MSIHTIRMPDIGEGIAEVEIVEWRVKVGDGVAEDQTLCEVMTDKAAVEVPSPAAGRVVELGGAIGQVMALGSVRIRIDYGSGAGEKVPAHAPPAQVAAVPTLGAGRGNAAVVRPADNAAVHSNQTTDARPHATAVAGVCSADIFGIVFDRAACAGRAGRARARPRSRRRSLTPEWQRCPTAASCTPISTQRNRRFRARRPQPPLHLPTARATVTIWPRIRRRSIR